MEFHSKVILITGAKGGLGTFVTNAFLDAGAQVVGVSRSISASDFPHGQFSAIPAELSSGENARKQVETVVEQHCRIDGLVHLMGGFSGGQSVAETDDLTLDRMLQPEFSLRFLHDASGLAAHDRPTCR